METEDKIPLARHNAHAETVSARPWPIWVTLGLLLVLWGRFFWSLTPEWELDPQYAHGWIVPILVGIIAYRRFSERPAPVPCDALWPVIGIAIALLPLGPLRFLEAVYPEARPFHWLHGTIAAVTTVLVLWKTGGKAWARHFAFPILFVLLAVPWPRAFQNEITGSLMHWVASVSVEIINLAGIPAWQQGNVIALTTSTVGVDEACSGIRSLQGSIMIGLFLGEEFRLAPLARIVLSVFAVGVSLMMNVVRAAILTWVCAVWSEERLHRWHDPAGLSILFLVFMVCLGGAKLLEGLFGRDAVGVREVRTPLSGSTWAGGMACFGLVWLLLIDISCAAYFLKAPETSAPGPRWTLNLERFPGIASDLPLGYTARQFLRYDTGRARKIEFSDGTIYQVLNLTWKGQEISAAGARLHNPLTCLPSAGYQLLEELPNVAFSSHNVECLFSPSKFRVGDRIAFVYHGLWEAGRPMVLDSVGDQSLASAIAAVRTKRRLGEARVFLLVMIGPLTAEDAESRLKLAMNQIIEVSPQP